MQHTLLISHLHGPFHKTLVVYDAGVLSSRYKPLSFTRLKEAVTMGGRKRQVTHKPLTDREWIVLQFVAEGLSNQEIAERLTLGLTTVKWYVKQIFNKLGADRRTQAVKLAKTLSLVEIESPAFASGPALPASLTPLIGREREIAELTQLLNDAAVPLVTILGPGGIGKTHLALEVARQQTSQFPGPVIFVALDGVSTSSEVILAVAEAIGFQFSGPLDSRQQLLGGLRGRRLLLVLDNFEHLLDVAPFVSEMLTAAPHLKILTTTRARLDLHAETVYVLGGLAYLPEVDPAQEHPAFKVFVQAARRSQPDLEITDDVAHHVTRICRSVEGMPLGLELAASWMAVLTPEQIADEIARSLSILETSLRDIPERHRSIYAVFEHSWRLLSDEEQLVFKKLSVFRGGFDHAAAKEVAGASLFMLGTLVDKSLVARVGPDRFKLHELLRQCAEDKLRASGQLQQTQSHHAEYFLKLTEDAEPHLRRADQLVWLQRLAVEQGNLRVVLGIDQSDTQDHERSFRMAAALGWYWYMHNQVQEGRTLLERFIDGISNVAPVYKIKVLVAAATLHLAENNFERAKVLLEDARNSCFLIVDQSSDALIANLLGVANWALKDSNQAEHLFKEAVKLAKQSGDLWQIAFALRSLGLFYEVTASHQNPLLAKQVQWEALQLAQQVGDRLLIAQLHASLAALAQAEGDHQQGQSLLEAGLISAREIGDNRSLASMLSGLGKNAVLQGDYDLAFQFYGESIRLCRELRDQPGIQECLIGFSRIAGAGGRFQRAAQLLGAVQLQSKTTFVTPLDEVDFDRFVQSIRSQLGEKVFSEATQMGRTMGLERSIAYALQAELEH